MHLSPLLLLNVTFLVSHLGTLTEEVYILQFTVLNKCWNTEGTLSPKYNECWHPKACVPFIFLTNLNSIYVMCVEVSDNFWTQYIQGGWVEDETGLAELTGLMVVAGVTMTRKEEEQKNWDLGRGQKLSLCGEAWLDWQVRWWSNLTELFKCKKKKKKEQKKMNQDKQKDLQFLSLSQEEAESDWNAELDILPVMS